MRYVDLISKQKARSSFLRLVTTPILRPIQPRMRYTAIQDVGRAIALGQAYAHQKSNHRASTLTLSKGGPLISFPLSTV